jgi:hypothetical protein
LEVAKERFSSPISPKRFPSLSRRKKKLCWKLLLAEEVGSVRVMVREQQLSGEEKRYDAVVIIQTR